MITSFLNLRNSYRLKYIQLGIVLSFCFLVSKALYIVMIHSQSIRIISYKALVLG